MALAVAVIAAFTSITAAVLSRRSARDAHQSADGIDRRRHMVEALDAETTSLRAAIESIYAAIAEVDLDTLNEFQIKNIARVHLLRMHPLCTDELGDAAMKGIDVVVRGGRAIRDGVNDPEEYSPTWELFWIEARRIFEEQAAKRSALVEDIRNMSVKRAPS